MFFRLLLVAGTIALADRSTPLAKFCFFDRVAPARGKATPADYVSAFDPANVTIVNKIRRMRVVTDQAGRQFFVRFQSKYDPTDFEVFASEFMAQAPGVQTPKLRWLTVEETRVLMTTLGRDVPDTADIGGRATIAPYYPEIPNGAQYLESLGLDPQQITLEQIKQLPPRLVTKLADLWALETVLGMDDFHAQNWMIKDGDVLAVDLANRTKAFTRGTETLDIPAARSPFGLADMDFTTRRFLTRQVSPQMRAYLKKQTSTSMRATAVGAGYPLSQRELNGMLNRVVLLLD